MTTNPLRLTILILAALLFAGCGDSDSQFSGQTVPAAAQVNPKLTGVWVAYFPGHQAGSNDRGVEIQFDRQEPKGFLLRGKGPHLQKVEVTRDGDSLRIALTDTRNSTDQSVLSGTLVDATTLRGSFVNESRGEDLPLDLKRLPDSDKLRSPDLLTESPGALSPGAQSPDKASGKPPAGLVEVLEIRATGDNSQLYSINIWLGDLSYFLIRRPFRSEGSCKILPLGGFSAWSFFELTLSNPANLNQGSLFVKIDDWTKVGYAPLSLPDSGDGSYLDTYPNGVNSAPTTTSLSNFVFEVVPEPGVTQYDTYEVLYDRYHIFEHYSSRFPAVTRSVARYLKDFGF